MSMIVVNKEIAKAAVYDEVIEIAKSMIEPVPFHGFDDGYNSALEDLIDTLLELKK